MSKETKNKVVPKLRFPEFEKIGGWERKRLGDVSDIRDGTHDSPKFFVKGKPLLTSKNLLSNGSLDFQNVSLISEKDYEQINKRSKVDIGDILFGMIGTIGNPVIVKADGFAIKNVALIKQKEELANNYLIHFLSSDYINCQFNYLVKGNAQKFIALGVIRNIIIYAPNTKEQEKIASCLSSLDDLITAQSQKLEALKEHKKGLMQQLFPAQGETVPKLRFQEFRYSGEWTRKTILDLSINGFSNGVFNDPSKVGYGYKLINVIDMYSEKPIDESKLSLVGISEHEFLKNKVEFGDIFFTRSSLVPLGIAQSNIYMGQSNVTFDGHLIRMRPDTSIVVPQFIHYLLKSNSVRTQLIAKGKRATMTTIGQSDIAGTILLHPTLPEQQKISDCLSSLDELITAQTEKIEALKEHKKGLMQQLFPNVND